MNHRRLMGIDLGTGTAHTVRVPDGEGAIVARRKASPTAESLTAVETAALVGCPAGTPAEGSDRAHRPGAAAGRGVLHRPRP